MSIFTVWKLYFGTITPAGESSRKNWRTAYVLKLALKSITDMKSPRVCRSSHVFSSRNSNDSTR